MVLLGVVIVTWNVKELVLQALSSLYDDLHASGIVARVVVVDSASLDDTAQAITQHFPQVELIASPENLGFAKGNNTGMRHLGLFDGSANAPDYVYLLNPDTITQKGATQALISVLETRLSVGVVGARLSYGDGSFQHGAFAFPGLRQLWAEFFPTHWRLREAAFNGRYRRALYEQPKPFDVDFTLGATWMLRREVITQTGGFDEAFFMYAEEVDWAWRIKKAGWQILSVPTSHVIHLGGQSTGQVKVRSLLNLWQSRLRLYEKHYPTWKLWLAKRMVAYGLSRQLHRLDPNSPRTPELKEAYQTLIKQALA